MGASVIGNTAPSGQEPGHGGVEMGPLDGGAYESGNSHKAAMLIGLT
jgi:hypothetical protein